MSLRRMAESTQADLYLASRRAQGLPDRVTDLGALSRVAALLEISPEMRTADPGKDRRQEEDDDAGVAPTRTG